MRQGGFLFLFSQKTDGMTFLETGNNIFFKVVLVWLFQRILFKSGHNLIGKALAHHVDLSSSPMYKTYTLGAL